MPDAAPVINIVVASKRDLRETTKTVDDRIKKNIESIDGVGQVRFIGERTRQIQVWLDGEKLYSYNLNIDQVRGALELVMGQPNVRGAIINLYGGINRMVEAAKGILAAKENLPDGRPIVVKILGNQQEEAWAMLQTAPNIHTIRVCQTEMAVAKLANLLE